MLRWVNAHKGAVVLIVIAVLAVSGTWLARGGDGGGGGDRRDRDVVAVDIGDDADRRRAGDDDS